MSAPTFVPPPLPPGWTEHIAPTGHVYYYNASTNESTYTRPLPSFANLPRPAQPVAKKKEKPLEKTPIPGTEWIRVRTTEGNVFYSHKPTKKSLWTMPDEIADAVRALELEEKAEEARRVEEARRAEEVAEVERVKAEAQEATGKRKADSARTAEGAKKKARIEEERQEDDGEDEDDEESEEEDWQREAAAQLEAEAEAAKRQQEEEEARLAEEERRQKQEMEAKSKQLNLPDRVDLSLDEAKALFKTLLREKDINPLHPWDTSLPLFVNDPRYILLPSVAARREAFDEYCRDRARELREQAVKEQKDAVNPKEAFERLLTEEVKSTRTSWTEWRRTWKKDRRFYGWGRDDREREKRFREFLKELGEKKRAEAKRAEANFFALLKESGVALPNSEWKDVKRKISHDPRYDAVGSSSLREELFNTYLKAHGTPNTEPKDEPAPQTETHQADNKADNEQLKKERRERAVREREAQVKANLLAVEANIGRSKMGLDKEEGENQFRTMLTDAIRDPQMTWDEALKELEKDPRFTHSPLPMKQRVHLFHTHIGQLRSKHLNNLHALFESHAPSLATPFNDLPLSSLLSSLPVTRLGYDERALEEEYDRWQRERATSARAAFDAMLGENTFVEFWGRLRKIGGEGVDGGVKADDYGDEDEGEGSGGRADMKKLAKGIDLREMEKVLKNDKRYVMFDHMPEARERWLRDYLENLAAPTLSVHVPK